MKETAPRRRLVTPLDAAEQLGVSLRTVYELMSSGALASIKLPPGGKTSPRRIDQAEINAFIDRNTVQITSVPRPKAAAS